MHGKICLVTGANSGVGKESALHLAKQGAKVLLICRNKKKGEDALAELKQQSGNDDLHLYLADLSSQTQIKQVAEQILNDIDRLDVLMNNAGVLMAKRTLTEDGLEATFAINHVAYFLLTYYLIDLLKKSAPARIVNVASDAQFRGKIEMDNLQGERKFRAFPFYNNSKLANVLFTYELARKLEGTGVTVNCLNPGYTNTGFGVDASWLWWFFFTFSRPIMISCREGAETQIYLATSPEVENLSGKYFEKSKEIPSSEASYDEGLAQRLWSVTESLTNVQW